MLDGRSSRGGLAHRAAEPISDCHRGCDRVLDIVKDEGTSVENDRVATVALESSKASRIGLNISILCLSVLW